MASNSDKPGFIRRTWRALTSPSARWSILALLLVGALGGAAAVVSTQVMVSATGSDEFCGGACHSMQWVAAEHKASSHGVNSKGVSAMRQTIATLNDSHKGKFVHHSGQVSTTW